MLSLHRAQVAAAGFALAVASFLTLGCTDALLEPRPADENNVSALLTLRGRVCTSPPDPSGFPVKVVMLVDQSGSMCISDPPGSQVGSGFCEQLPAGVVPPGVTTPARVRALQSLAAQFARQSNVQLAIVPFETNVRNVWPPNTTGDRFAPPDPSLDTYLGMLQTQLGKGTDYQGALAYAYSLIATDIQDVATTNPAQLPRTKYVVVFLTDGTPYPRCSANDNLATYADPSHPEGTWPDSSSAVDFCNILDPSSPDAITGYVVGTDRNQNYQIFNYVDRLMELKDAYNIGDIRVHTILLFNQTAVELCGDICQDVYGTYPGYYWAQAAHDIARWTLRQIADRGNGVYQEFLNSDIQNLGLGALDYASLASPFVMKQLLLQPLSSMPSEGKRIVDSDGDGLSDEQEFDTKTAQYAPDSDVDCFDDRFEVTRGDRGFRATIGNDTRSCPSGGCVCADTDGDGLSQYAEDFLKTRRGLIDSDGDGVPDGLEARYRLDPVGRSAADLDTDGDGIPDDREFRAGTDPTFPDRELYERDGFQYEITAELQADQSTCYDYAITNVRMVSPPSRAGYGQGYNRFKIWFAEAPASGVSTDYGVWRAGCAAGRYAPPGVREPAGPEIPMTDGDFRFANELVTEGDYLSYCQGAQP